MGQINRQVRRLELLETKADEFGRFKTAAALELKALAQRVADLETVVEALCQSNDKLKYYQPHLRTALTGSWRERREARKALR